MQGDITSGKILFTDKLSFSPSLEKEVEVWVVNTLKVKMIKKLDNMLEKEGRNNARKLFLVPIFTIPELVQRIETQAPEIKTFFYRELMGAIAETKKT